MAEPIWCQLSAYVKVDLTEFDGSAAPLISALLHLPGFKVVDDPVLKVADTRNMLEGQ